MIINFKDIINEANSNLKDNNFNKEDDIPYEDQCD